MISFNFFKVSLKSYTKLLVLCLLLPLFTNCKKDTPDNKFNVVQNKINPSQLNNLIGEWNIDCGLEITEFSIGDNNHVFIFLYSDNAIYINGILKKNQNKEGSYNLFFDSVSSQENYYKDKKNIVEDDVSKKEKIATIRVINNKMIELNWRGLYNVKTNKFDFIDDFLLKKEYNNLNPIILKRCDSL